MKSTIIVSSYTCFSQKRLFRDTVMGRSPTRPEKQQYPVKKEISCSLLDQYIGLMIHISIIENICPVQDCYVITCCDNRFASSFWSVRKTTMPGIILRDKKFPLPPSPTLLIQYQLSMWVTSNKSYSRKNSLCWSWPLFHPFVCE